MANPTGFLQIDRIDPVPDLVAERTSHFNEFHAAMDQNTIVSQAARCMDCGVPFCNAGTLTKAGSIGCPLGNLIPETNDLVYQGKHQLAYDRLSLTHPFPEFTSRVCPALCEGSCTLGEHEESVSVKEIERFLSDGYGVNRPHQSISVVKTDIANAAKDDQPSVAIIGSGPAGLAAASTLIAQNCNVIVYERSDRPGGLLMYGIPNMKLEKELVENRVNLLKNAGVQFVTNCAVGRDFSFADLKAQSDAVIVCTGATLPRPLTIEGADLTGVVPAVQYLTANTKHVLDAKVGLPAELDATGKNVVIIGGGDTGTDCIATAIRQGATSVRQIEINPASSHLRSKTNPWPLWPFVFKTDYAQTEALRIFGADPREFASTVTKIIGKAGKVTAVETANVSWEMVKGQRKLNIDETTRVTKPADLVIYAMGFLGPEPELLAEAKLATNERSNVQTEAGYYATSQEGVFTAGDCHRGQSLVVWAIAEGVAAAQECMNWLKHGV